jgi:hypothetical protein
MMLKDGRWGRTQKNVQQGSEEAFEGVQYAFGECFPLHGKVFSLRLRMGIGIEYRYIFERRAFLY